MRFVKFVLAFALIGGMVGFIFGQLKLNGFFLHWQSLGSPPEKAVKIIHANERFVQVASISGMIYDCFISDGPHWEINTQPYTNQYETPVNGFKVPRPLKDVVDQKVVLDYYGPGMIYTVYSVRSDGRVYRWQEKHLEWDFLVAWITYPLVGLGLGCLVGLFVYIYGRD
jgi:hypothetical protein